MPHWFEGDKPFARAIVQVGVFTDPDLPNVPMLGDLVDSKQKALVDFVASAGPLGRDLTLPPGVDSRIVATLRKAYDAMNADKEFAKELKKKKLRLMASDGKTIQAIVEKAIKSATPEVISRVRKIVYGGSS